MAEFDITATHPTYDAYAPSWRVMRDAIDGEDCVKKRDTVDRQTYLPIKSGMKAMTDQDAKRVAYEAYKQRAEFPEIVSPTVRGALGMIHAKDSAIELPKVLEPLRDKATRDGLTLTNFHQRISAELLRVGRYGIMPGVDERGDFHLAGYTTESAINWDAPNGPLSYLVLNESAPMRDPETNKWTDKARYRECALAENGAFQSRVWVETGKRLADGKKEFAVDGDWVVARIKGRDGLPVLPFTFIDVMDLTPDPDDVPLYGLAKLALRAYRLDADYVTALHMTSEPTPYVIGVDKESAPKSIGASALWVLPDVGASAGYLEFSGPGLDAQEKAIQNTLERAIMFGAQLFSDNRRTAESGDAIKLRLGNQTSALKMVAVQSAAGLKKCLQEAAIWAGANPDEVEVKPNLDFVDHELSPQEITALVAGWQSGAYSRQTLFENLQRGGIIDPEREFEDEMELIDEDAALALMRDPAAAPADDTAEMAAE